MHLHHGAHQQRRGRPPERDQVHQLRPLPLHGRHSLWNARRFGSQAEGRANDGPEKAGPAEEHGHGGSGERGGVEEPQWEPTDWCVGIFGNFGIFIFLNFIF